MYSRLNSKFANMEHLNFLLSSENCRFLYEKNKDCITFFPTDKEKKAVCIVSHGLNNSPGAMRPLIYFLNSLNIDVYLVKLYGHYKQDTYPIRKINDNQWHNELITGYCSARKIADDNNLPLFFLGYSLGALVMQHLIQLSKGEINIDKQILLSPAVTLRNYTKLLKATFFLNDRTIIPSYSPPGYRANKGIPVKMYRFLFQFSKEIISNEFQYLDFPTLVIMDPKDELISLQKLKKYKNKYSLTNYKFLELNSKEAVKEIRIHHLIIDERTMGDKNWNLAKKNIKMFLFS